MAAAQPDRHRESGGHLPARYPFPPEAVYPDEEISLVDLWLVLRRRRMLIAAIFAGALALGLAAALLKPETFAYTTSVQIARTGDGPIESPETVKAKLEASYIPLVLNGQFGSDGNAGPGRFTVEAEIPKDGRIIVLKSQGTSDAEAEHARLHRAILEKIAQDHAPELRSTRQSLEAEVGRAARDLERLQDQARLLANKEGRLEERRRLIEQQIDEVGALILSAQQRQRDLVEAGEGSNGTAALVMIESEIQGHRERRATLEQRLKIELPAERDQLDNALAENRRAQVQMREELQAAEANLAGLRPTRAIASTLRSTDPVGTAPTVLVVLAAVLGLMVGVFGAFFAEFLSKVRERAQAEEARGSSPGRTT